MRSASAAAEPLNAKIAGLEARLGEVAELNAKIAELEAENAKLVEEKGASGGEVAQLNAKIVKLEESMDKGGDGVGVYSGTRLVEGEEPSCGADRFIHWIKRPAKDGISAKEHMRWIRMLVADCL